VDIAICGEHDGHTLSGEQTSAPGKEEVIGAGDQPGRVCVT